MRGNSRRGFRDPPCKSFLYMYSLSAHALRRPSNSRLKMTSGHDNDHNYELLPTTDPFASPSERLRVSKPTRFARHIFTKHRRKIRWLIKAISRIFFGGVALYFLYVLWYGGIPPSYAEIRARERALPQHHWKQKPPGKYVTEGPKFMRFQDH